MNGYLSSFSLVLSNLLYFEEKHFLDISHQLALDKDVEQRLFADSRRLSFKDKNRYHSSNRSAIFPEK